MSFLSRMARWRRSLAGPLVPARRTAPAPRDPALAESVEPRILYSADALAGLLPATSSLVEPDAVMPSDLSAEQTSMVLPAESIDAADVRASAAAAWSPEPASVAARPTELVFVDPGVPDAQRLVDAIAARRPDAAFHIIELDPTCDGLAQITEALAGQREVAAIHIVSHGDPGAIELNGRRIDAAAIETDANQFTAWRAALGDQADLLIYGCDVASTPAGIAMLMRLAELTGADVAGSTDPTGSTDAGGDWTLEASTGAIQAGSLFADGDPAGWRGLLPGDVPVLDPSASPTMPSILEGATNPSGITVAALVVDGSITNGAAAGEAIAIIALDTSLGTWQYSTNGGTSWLTIDAEKINSSTNELALLLGPTASLRILPFGDLSGTLNSAITFRAWGMATGATGDYVAITSPGNIALGSDFSADNDTASLTVTPVNDAPTFAPVTGTGNLMVPFGGTDAYGSSAIVQPDGKILVAGYTVDSDGLGDDFSVIRLNADGSLDTSFDGDGKLIVPVGIAIDYGYSLTVQPDGKILVAGFSLTLNYFDFSLIRLNADGSLDTTFDGDGKLLVPVGSGSDADYGYSLTVQPDGKILVAGHSFNGIDSDFSLIRLNANGSLDTTFDGDGKLMVPVGSNNDYGYSLSLQPDGKILVAGYSSDGINNDFSLIRLNANGSLDTSFNGDGKLIVPVGSGNDMGYSITVQSDGKILVAGQSFNGSDNDFGLIRLNGDGSLDTSFDGDGKLIVPMGSGGDNGRSVTVQPDGKILVAGHSGAIVGTVIRLNGDGSLDNSFNGDGKRILPVGGISDVGYSVSLQPDGKILVAGTSANGSYQFSLIRLNADGSLDTTFNGTAANTLGGSVSYTEGAAAVALDAGVAIYDADLAALNGGAGDYNGASITLARDGGASPEDVFSALGNLSFASGNAVLSGVTVGTVSNAAGTLSITFNSNATQARVNELLSSLAYANSSGSPPASVQIVWTFSDGNTSAQGSGGALTAQGMSTVNITLNPGNQSPVLDTAFSPTLGSVLEGASNPAGVTVSWLIDLTAGQVTDADGSLVDAIAITALDTSLGTWQYSTDGGANWLTIDADKINSATNELALLLGPTAHIRMLPFGDLNGTLSTAITFRAWDMTSGATGDYTVITTPGTGTSAFSAASDTASLTVTAVNDAPTFSPVAGSGKLMVPVGSSNDYGQSITVQPDGKILVAGYSSNGGSNDLSLIRLNGDGSLDTSFDADGKLIVPVGSSADIGRSVTLQPDGKILVAGYAFTGGVAAFSMIRLNGDGSLDTSFDGDGKLIVPVGSGSASGCSVTVQPDGKILVAGESSNGTDYDFSLIRLNVDGSLDFSFDDDGKLIVPVGSSHDLGYSVSVQPDGKILVAGHAWNGTDYDFSLIRLNADGTLDTTFDNDGKSIVPVGSGNDYGYSLSLQPDGKILVAGHSRNGTDYDFSLIRLNADGTLDTTFDNDGKFIVPVGSSHDDGYSVSLQSDGKILLAGNSSNGIDNDFSLIRLNADGSLDTSFDGDGKLIVEVGSGTDNGSSLSLQRDGKILVAGTSRNGTDNDFSLIRVNADGSLDTTFNGTAANTLGGSVGYTENAAAVALDAGVAIYDADLAALNSGAGDYNGASITLARDGGANAEDVFSALGNLIFTSSNAVLSGVTVGAVSNAAGTLSITFNSNATQARVDELLSSLAYVNASDAPPASVQIVWTFSDGNSSAQGGGDALTAQGASTVNITAVNDPPVLNTGFGGLGNVLEGATNPGGITVSMLIWFVGGTVDDAEGYDADAIAITALDTSLGTWQYSTDGGANWLTIDADKINSTTNELALLLGPTAHIRMLPFGDLNGTLSSAITFRAWDMSTGATGDYTVISNPGTGTSAFSAASDTASLTVTAVNDAPTFSPVAGSGKLMVPVGSSTDSGQSMVVQPDGKILVAGTSFNGTDDDFSLIRLNADGTLDTTFDGDGKLIVPVGSGVDIGRSVTVQPDGKILVAGQSFNGSDNDFSLIRLNVDGSLDTSFDGDGKLIVSVGSGDDVSYSVSLQPDGKILVAGFSVISSDYDFSLIRLNINGSLDTSFDGDGMLTLTVGSSVEVVTSISVQSDGKILLAGYSYAGSDSDFSLIRLNGDGSLDTSFDGDGKLIVAVGSGVDAGMSLTAQPDGKILLAGYSLDVTNSNYDFSLIRLNGNGSLDSSFGNNGKLLVPVGSGSDFGWSLTLQPDGKILVAGQSFNGSDNDFSLIRLNGDGSLDIAFGSNGKLIVPIGSVDDSGRSITLQPDGKILVAGQSLNGYLDFSVIRLNTDGSLDTTFNGSAANTLGGSVSYTAGAAAVALDAGVAIYDADLAALNNGAGDYNGASITLARNGGANADDVFSALGNLSFASGNAVLSGVTIGTVSNAAGTLSITFNSNATQARVNELLSSLAYVNTSNSPPASVQIVWTFSDGNTSAQGSGGALTTQGTTTVNITSVNDAPSGTSATLTTNEDTAWVFAATDFGFTDTSDSPANALMAVTMSSLPTAGSLMLAGAAVTVGQSISIADINAGRLVFTPVTNANANAYASFTFRVQDNGGTANGGIDLDPTAKTITFNVTAVNDTPSGASTTLTTNEDSAWVFAATDFGFSDTSDSPANALMAVSISSLPTAGSLTLASTAVTVGQSISVADINAGRLVFTPVSNTNGNAYESFTFRVQDNGGTANGGVDIDLTARTITFNVTPVNDAPSGANSTLTINEDTPWVFAASDFGFTDLNDSPANALMAVTMSSLPTAGSLTLAGAAVTVGQSINIADIDAGRLVFTPVSNSNGTGYASFTFRVLDNGGTANGGVDLDLTARSITFNVTAVNDAPSGANATFTTTEGTPWVFAATDFGFTDASDTPANALMAVTVSSLPIAGSLTLSGTAVTAGQSISIADINAGRLVFTSGADANGTGYASFTFRVQDNGGTANGGVALDLTARSITFNVTAVNDAPSGANATFATTEGTPWVLAAPDFGFTDTSDSPANTFSAVTISSLATAGSLTLAGTAVTVGQSISIADINAGRLVFTPVSNTNGNSYASFTFRVQDNGGTANGGVDLDPTARTITFNVTAVNDAPSGANVTFTTTEDTRWVFAAADFGFTDASDTPANALMAVTMSSLPTAGSLTLAGTAVTVGQSISIADINAGRLVFTPVTNANDNVYASFSFRVQDNGGTANGGVDLDLTARTITFNVTPVNDAPSGANSTFTTNEDTPWVFAATDFGFTDTNDSPANALMAVTMSSLPTSGSLMLAGAAVTVGQSISIADINAGRLVFTPVTNASGTGYASFTFRVQDNGGTANGGVDLDPAAKTINFNVIAVNDAPSGADKTLTTGEATPWVFAATDFGFTDTNDSPANALMAVSISSLPTAGSLTLSGTAVTAGQSISIADINAGRLVFTPVTNTNGNSYASFTFRVQDNGGTANGGVDLDPTAKTITFNVTPFNRAPVITSNGGGANAWVSVTESSTSVTQVTAADIDLPAQRLAYSIVGGADAARFVIDADTGLLSFVSAPRWHLPADANGDNQYEVVVGADDGSLLTAQALAITVTNLPDAPVVTAPPSATLLENTGIPVPGLVLSDVDGNLSTVSLRVQHGSLALDLAGGAIIIAGEQGSSTITLGGNASQLQAALASLSYRSVRDFHGSDTLQVLATDATGLQASASTAITITPINHLPELNAPGAQATLTGMPLEFRAQGNNPIFISDIDDIEATLRVTLAARGGSLSIATVDGLTLAPQLSAGADSMLIVEGPMGAINAALASLSFLPNDDFFGETSLELIVRDLTDPASGVDLSRSVPIEVSLPPTFAPNPISQVPVSTPPITTTPVTSTPVALTPVVSTPVGTTTVTSSPVGTTAVVTSPVGSSSLPAAGTASATDAASGRASAKPTFSAGTSAPSGEESLAPIVPSLITAVGTERSDIAIRLIAPAEMSLISPIDLSAARRLESSVTVSTVVRAFESQALLTGVFVVTPDSVSVIGLADDTRTSIGASQETTETRLRSESLEPPRTVGDELTLSSLSVQSAAAAVSAGVLWWLVNGGTLLWIVLAYGPLARTFDPLPILARERRDDEDDDGLPDRQDPLDVPTLFDDPNAPSPAHAPVPDDISRETAAIVESA